MTCDNMKVLELYSGIGGMHYALRESGIPYEVVASVDINTGANEVYKHNFPTTVNLNRNIQSFNAKDIAKLSVDAVLMSPPCQPFTRVGLKKDILDERTNSLLHVLTLIPSIETLKYILVENVKGFEVSQARDRLIECVLKSGFNYKEFILSPCQFGVPNTRHRYYLVAKKEEMPFCFVDPSLVESIPEELMHILRPPSSNRKMKNGGCWRIKDILEVNIDETDYLIPSKILEKHVAVLDIQTSASSRSCCFTKAYSRYAEGTGSVFCPYSTETISEKYSESQKFREDVKQKMEVLNSLKLRYFSPREVSRLMCFPESFDFPKNTSKKQMYKLLGNSINVYVVSQLILLLKHGDAEHKEASQ